MLILQHNVTCSLAMCTVSLCGMLDRGPIHDVDKSLAQPTHFGIYCQLSGRCAVASAMPCQGCEQMQPRRVLMYGRQTVREASQLCAIVTFSLQSCDEVRSECPIIAAVWPTLITCPARRPPSFRRPLLARQLVLPQPFQKKLVCLFGIINVVLRKYI